MVYSSTAVLACFHDYMKYNKKYNIKSHIKIILCYMYRVHISQKNFTVGKYSLNYNERAKFAKTFS